MLHDVIFMTAVRCIISEEETHKIAPSPWDFVTMPEEDEATAIGNMRKKFGKDRAWFHKYPVGQTDTILRHCSRGRSNKSTYDFLIFRKCILAVT